MCVCVLEPVFCHRMNGGVFIFIKFRQFFVKTAVKWGREQGSNTHMMISLATHKAILFRFTLTELSTFEDIILIDIETKHENEAGSYNMQMKQSNEN